MNRLMLVLGLLFGLCIPLLGQTSSPANPAPATASSPTTSAPVTLELAPEEDAKFRFGQVTDSLLTIKNTSDRAILVQALVPMVNAEDPIEPTGRISANYEDTNIAHEAFLLPGQQVIIEAAYRPLFARERFAVVYRQAAQKYDGTAESIAPFKPFIQQLAPDGRFHTEAAYGRFSVNTWLAVCKLTKQPIKQPGPYASTRAILLPDAKSLPEAIVSEVEVPIAFAGTASFLGEQALPLAAKIAKVPAEKIRLAYSKIMGGYIVYGGEKPFVLKNAAQTAPEKTLPDVPPTLFKDCDRGQPVYVRVGTTQPEDPEESAGWKLWGKLPVVYGDGNYLKGEFVQADAALPQFLQLIGDNAATLRPVTHYFRSRSYDLRLKGDLLPSTQPGTR